MGYYWKALNYNLFKLVSSNGSIKDFDSFDSLCTYCQLNNINAIQV